MAKMTKKEMVDAGYITDVSIITDPNIDVDHELFKSYVTFVDVNENIYGESQEEVPVEESTTKKASNKKSKVETPVEEQPVETPVEEPVVEKAEVEESIDPVEPEA